MNDRYEFMAAKPMGDKVVLIYWDLLNHVYTYSILTVEAGWPTTTLWQGGFDNMEACLVAAVNT